MRNDYWNMKAHQSFSLWLISVLGVLAMACGGGGGGGGSPAAVETSASGTTDVLPNLVSDLSGASSLKGQVLFEVPRAKGASVLPLRQKGEGGSIQAENIKTGDVYTSHLDAQGNFEMEVPKGLYEMTAISAQSKVLKAVSGTQESRQEEIVVDMDSTAVVAYLLSSKKEAFSSISEQEVDMVTKTLKQADDHLVSGESSASEKSVSLQLLSIKDHLLNMSSEESVEVMMNKDALVARVSSKQVLEERYSEVSVKVMERTGQPIKMFDADGKVVEIKDREEASLIVKTMEEHTRVVEHEEQRLVSVESSSGNQNIQITEISVTEIHNTVIEQHEVVIQISEREDEMEKEVTDLANKEAKKEDQPQQEKEKDIVVKKDEQRNVPDPLEVVDSESSRELIGDDLLAFYHMDEGYGSLLSDGTGNGLHGIIRGADRTEHAFRGQALYFDGVSDRVELPAFGFGADRRELSVSLWMKASDFSISDARLISQATSDASKDHVFMLSTVAQGNDVVLRARLQTSNGKVKELRGKERELKAGQWTHVAMVYDGQRLSLYQDRALVSSVALEGMVANLASVPVAIGDQPHGGKAFHGKIDDVRIYGKALSVVELSELATEERVAPELLVEAKRFIALEDVLELHSESDVEEVRWDMSHGPAGLQWLETDTTSVSFENHGIYHFRAEAGEAPYMSVAHLKVAVGQPLEKHALHHWDMNESSGEMLADIVGAHMAVAIGGASHEGLGNLGSSRYLDGVDDYIDLGQLQLPSGLEGLTIAAWIFPKSFENGDARIISKADGTKKDDHVWMLSTITRAGEAYLRARLTNSEGKTYECSAKLGALQRFDWQHVMMRFDGVALELYLDGHRVQSVEAHGLVADGIGIPARIGANPVGGKAFHGLIDEVRIFNSALSSDERWVLLNEGLSED